MKLPVTQVDQINHTEAGRMIRELRVKKKKSLRWLASELGFSPPFVSDLELGRRNWSALTFYHAADILTRKSAERLKGAR